VRLETLLLLIRDLRPHFIICSVIYFVVVVVFKVFVRRAPTYSPSCGLKSITSVIFYCFFFLKKMKPGSTIPVFVFLGCV
jgi:hypothetical protein